jgi:hypothetical protein
MEFRIQGDHFFDRNYPQIGALRPSPAQPQSEDGSVWAGLGNPKQFKSMETPK